VAINGYWWLFHYNPLMIILLVAIDGYQWLLVIIVLLIIVGYYML
jgi:hypothetical protein